MDYSHLNRYQVPNNAKIWDIVRIWFSKEEYYVCTDRDWILCMKLVSDFKRVY
jgi:hypothetical protein